MSLISKENLTDAYIEMLRDSIMRQRSGKQFLQVTEVLQPIDRDRHSPNVTFSHWKFSEFVFPSGRTGWWWLQNRLDALLNEKGEYWNPLHADSQLDYTIEALSGMLEGTMPRWNSNRIVLTLFRPKDSHLSRAPTPPCMILIEFKPVRNILTLIATFRAQYTDTKGYGNMISLAYLLLQLCDKTGFKPGLLYNIVHKPLLRHKEAAPRLLKKLTMKEVPILSGRELS